MYTGRKKILIILSAVIIMAAIAAVVFVCLCDDREYHIFSVETADDTRVVRYALALAEIRHDFPVDDVLLKQVLADDRAGLPEYITDVRVFEDGLSRDGEYIGRDSAEMVLKKKNSVLAVFETEGGDMRYAYIRRRPKSGHDIILPDGSFPTMNTEVPGYLYEGVDLLNYPTLSVREVRESTSPEEILGDDGIRVQMRRVGYIPDHHSVFNTRHHP